MLYLQVRVTLIDTKIDCTSKCIQWQKSADKAEFSGRKKEISLVGLFGGCLRDESRSFLWIYKLFAFRSFSYC